jgi:hypothetical protein
MVGERMIQYLNCVAFPATRAASAATTISSAVMNPFEMAAGQRNTASRSVGDTNNYPVGYGWLNSWGNFGAAKIVLRATDRTGVRADSVSVNIYVSFDKGASYQTFGTYTMPAAGLNWGAAGATGNPFFITVPFAPRMFITATLSAAQLLVAGHGLSVDVEFEEYMSEQYRTVSTVYWADTKLGWNGGLAAGIPAANYTQVCPDTKYGGDSVWSRISYPVILNQLSRPQRVAIVGYMSNRAGLSTVNTKGNMAGVLASTAQVIWIQSSLDGTYWYNADSMWAARPIPGTGIFVGEEEAKPIPAYLGNNTNTSAYVTSITGVKEPGVAKQGVLSKYIRLQMGPKYQLGLGYSQASQSGPRFWVIAFY